MKSFKNEKEALRHENYLLSKDVAAALHSRSLWRAKARSARSENDAMFCENVRLGAALAAMNLDLGEAKADNDRREEELARLRAFSDEHEGCDEAQDDRRKLAEALQIVAAELDRLVSGGLKLHKNEVKRIREMIQVPVKTEAAP